jgi:peptidoglycan hydrolase-like protein with peptidoglycan-binding domain
MTSVSRAHRSGSTQTSQPTLEAPRAGLKYGMRGPEVQKLQESLVKLGYMTKAEMATGPGIFGPRTWRALANFKAAHGLKKIGVYGPKAREALTRALAGEPGRVRNNDVPAGGGGRTQGTTPTPRPRPADPTTPTERVNVGNIRNLSWDKAADIIRARGGQVNPGGKPTVLAVRTANGGTSGYNDFFVVLKPGGKMAVFEATTRPTSLGAYGKAMVLPGNYELSPRWRDGKFSNDAFLLKNASGGMTVDVARDVNGDGRYSEREMTAGYDSDLIRLHRGGSNSTASSGCFNVKDYDAFLRFVGGRDVSFNLTLVED